MTKTAPSSTPNPLNANATDEEGPKRATAPLLSPDSVLEPDALVLVLVLEPPLDCDRDALLLLDGVTLEKDRLVLGLASAQNCSARPSASSISSASQFAVRQSR